MDNKDQVKGNVKQAVGDLTGNEDLKKEAKADENVPELLLGSGPLGEPGGIGNHTELLKGDVRLWCPWSLVA
jgi:hypothetical protein